MTPSLRDVVVAQRTLVLRLIDLVESTMTLRAIGQLRDVLHGQIAAEREVLVPLAADASEGVSYGGELHAVVQFVLERICAPEATPTERGARLRVLRDLLVHQTERDEWIVIERIEAKIGARAAASAARRFEKSLADGGATAVQLERGTRTAPEGRRTGR